MIVKPWIKATVGILLSFAILFVGVGYAAITTELAMGGEIDIDIPSGLFITEITTESTTDVDHQSVEFLRYSTTIKSVIDKKNNTTTSGYFPWQQTTVTYAGSVTYRVTVINNTAYDYAYRGLYYQSSEYNNSSVSTSNANNKLGVVTSFPDGSFVPAGSSLTFEVTYTVGQGLGDAVDWTSLLNFQFGINVDSIDKAANIVHDKFAEILNNGITYRQLVDTLDDKFDGNQEWTSNYIGNVGNAVDNDMMTVETLFAGQLTMMVNGVAQKAWVIIKHENLDGNELTGDDYTLTYNQAGVVTHKGCEMTLYMTVDPLSQANGWAPVYVTVFTCDRDEAGNTVSEWYQIGDTYYGRANIVGYKGESNGTGSFVTDNWVSYAETYPVTDKYFYSVAEDQTIKSLVQLTDQQTVNAFQTLLTDAEAMIANNKYAGTGITVVEEAYERAAKYYTVDASGKAIANAGTRRAWLLSAIYDLDHVLTVAQEAIDKVEQGQ